MRSPRNLRANVFSISVSKTCNLDASWNIKRSFPLNKSLASLRVAFSLFSLQFAPRQFIYSEAIHHQTEFSPHSIATSPRASATLVIEDNKSSHFYWIGREHLKLNITFLLLMTSIATSKCVLPIKHYQSLHLKLPPTIRNEEISRAEAHQICYGIQNWVGGG